MRKRTRRGERTSGLALPSRSRVRHEAAAEEESMRIRTTLAILIAGALVVAACQTGQTPGPKVWKIGLVTDVGKLDDKSFNEASWLAVPDAKTQFRAQVDNIVTRAPADYQTNMKA